MDAPTPEAEREPNAPRPITSKRQTLAYLAQNTPVPGVGVEPTWALGPRDFKSLASTSSATPACCRTCDLRLRLLSDSFVLPIIPAHADE